MNAFGGINMDSFHHELELSIRIIVALVIGVLIGMERAKKGKPAGIRTHALVCIGSALAMVLSGLNEGQYRDPMRLAAQVISGIGFIGAGVIWMDSSNVKRGLTTAANLWITSIIGLAIGYGALVLTVVTFICIYVAFSVPALLKLVGVSFSVHSLDEESDDENRDC